jgi:hypothetical protein
MNAGTNDRKKVIMLGGLVLVAGYLFYSNVLSGPSVSSSSAAVAPRPAGTPDPALSPVTAPPANAPTAPRNVLARGRGDEFRPVVPGHSKRPEDKFEPDKVDPTLRLDLLAKIQEENATAGRNLFQFGMAPVKQAEALKGPEPKVLPKPVAAVTPVKVDTPPAGPPPPPPINLKYYGYSSAQGSTTKTAFFLDGEDILTAREGDIVKRRYKVVRIGNNSAVMEDTESKRQQTIPLAEEAG